MQNVNSDDSETPLKLNLKWYLVLISWLEKFDFSIMYETISGKYESTRMDLFSGFLPIFLPDEFLLNVL